MQLTVNGHDVTVTQALHGYVSQQLEHMKKRLTNAKVSVLFVSKRKTGRTPSIHIVVRLKNRVVKVIKQLEDFAAKSNKKIDEAFAELQKVLDKVAAETSDVFRRINSGVKIQGSVTKVSRH